MNLSTLSRRHFLQSTLAAAATFSLKGWSSDEKSQVLEIHRAGMMKDKRVPDAAAVQEMLDKGMQAFTGEKSRRDQWARFVSKDDVVGIKVNSLGGVRLCSKKELVQTIIQCLLELGIPENKIIVWDRRSDHLRNLGMGTNLGNTGVRVYASDHKEIGYSENAVQHGSSSSHLSKIWTDQVTAIINVPIMKDHRRAGTTLSLKNISHGIVDNPQDFHENYCDPYIAQINAVPEVVQKHRLVVMDAIQGSCDGGPHYSPKGFVNYESLFFSTDCVALDTIGTERIEQVRREKGMPTLEEKGTPTIYLASAAKLGLGNGDKSKIDHRIIEG